MDYNPQHRV